MSLADDGEVDVIIACPELMPRGEPELVLLCVGDCEEDFVSELFEERGELEVRSLFDEADGDLE